MWDSRACHRFDWRMTTGSLHSGLAAIRVSSARNLPRWALGYEACEARILKKYGAGFSANSWRKGRKVGPPDGGSAVGTGEGFRFGANFCHDSLSLPLLRSLRRVREA